jgi:hypothetical protein
MKENDPVNIPAPNCPEQGIGILPSDGIESHFAIE